MVGQQDHEFEVILRRNSPDTPWGFRLQGGAECQAPLTIQRVSRDVLFLSISVSGEHQTAVVAVAQLKG